MFYDLLYYHIQSISYNCQHISDKKGIYLYYKLSKLGFLQYPHKNFHYKCTFILLEIESFYLLLNHKFNIIKLFIQAYKFNNMGLNLFCKVGKMDSLLYLRNNYPHLNIHMNFKIIFSYLSLHHIHHMTYNLYIENILSKKGIYFTCIINILANCKCLHNNFLNSDIYKSS